MIENLAYLIMGFAATYLSLEVAWHFTACRIKENGSDKKMEKMMKPCMFKEMKIVLTAPQASSGRVM